MKPVKLGLLGVGTVGTSTALVLKNNAAEIARRAGRHIEIVQASRRSVAAGIPEGSGDIALTEDPFEVVNNPEIDILIEAQNRAQHAMLDHHTGDNEAKYTTNEPQTGSPFATV